MNKDNFEVRDLRQSEWFFIDNALYDRLLPVVQNTAFLVYISLCRYADKNQSCFPSIVTLAKKLHFGERTVARALKVLEDCNAIAVERKIGYPNIYWLIERRYWRYPKPPSQATTGCDVTPDTADGGDSGDGGPPAVMSPDPCHHSRSNNPYLKRTNKNLYPDEAKEAQRGNESSLSGKFERFWAAYPRKRSKGQAEKAWIALKPDEALLSKMLEVLEGAKNSPDWQKENGQFIPYPATWLRAKGWEDEHQTVKAARPDSLVGQIKREVLQERNKKYARR